ncbi:MAG TPA: D-2-hydroxyacid dehydrogenase [Ktedonobacteraceae bacterium]|jgi:phosphoglycerate dehydrogenase-like enzyme|nr:D-2-hydroxyacid dehydrogenase [Ktedonobacteraceae bacterium]
MADRLNVLSAFQFSSASLKLLREAAGTEVVCVANNEELWSRLQEAEVLCSYSVPNQWRELAPHLRWLQVASSAVDSLRFSGILETGGQVQITTAIGMNATVIGEYVFGSILMFNRNWPEMVRLQDRHVWPLSSHWYRLGGRELTGQTLGIVGFGSIGRRVAQLGRAFGMRVLATHRSAHAGDQDADVDQLFASIDLIAMLRQSNYVVLAVPLTAETEGLIGEAELRAMPTQSYLVNVARGRVVQQEALIRALREGWIGGAGLDVVMDEPLPAESPLYRMPNVILTPHIAGVSVQYDQRLAALFADNLRRYRAGQPLLNRYEPARGY